MQALQHFLSCLHLNINLWKFSLLLNISMFFFKITNQFVTLIQWRKMISLKGVDVFDGGEIAT